MVKLGLGLNNLSGREEGIHFIYGYMASDICNTKGPLR